MNGLMLTQAAYARHRGCSKQYVGKLVKSGKIRLRDGRIDAVAADLALEENQQRPWQARARSSAEQDAFVDASATGEGVRGGVRRDGEEAVGPDGKPTQSQALRDKTLFEARRAELKYRKEAGQLLDIGQVEKAAQVIAERLVRDVDQLPHAADDLATAFASGGVPALRAALKRQARRLRQTLAESMALLVAASETDAGAGENDEGTDIAA